MCIMYHLGQKSNFGTNKLLYGGSSAHILTLVNTEVVSLVLTKQKSAVSKVP